MKFRMFLLAGVAAAALLCGCAGLGGDKAPLASGGGRAAVGRGAPDPMLLPILEGWKDAVVLSNRLAVAVVAPSAGRLVYFAANGGESLLRCDGGLIGKAPKKSGDTFFNVGGDWLWPVPQAYWPVFSEHGGDWPPPAALRDAAWRAVENADGSLTLIREYGAPVHVVVSRTFWLHPPSESPTATLSIHQRITRTDHSDVPVVLWNVSQIAHAEAVTLPLAKRSAFEGGVQVLSGGRPGPDVLRVDAGAQTATYFVQAGAEVKLGTDAGAEAGAVSAVRGETMVSEVMLELEGFPAGAVYPDGGCSHEVYVNEGLGYCEIETLSPETLLPPGLSIANRVLITVDVP